MLSLFTTLMQKLVEEMKLVPWTALSVLFMWAVFWYVVVAVWPPVSAATEEVQRVSSKIEALQEVILGDRVYEARMAQCRANTQEMRELMTEKLQQRKEDYKKVVGSEYLMPECSDFNGSL